MTSKLVICLTTLLICTSAGARIRAVRPPASFPAPRVVMWIAAHPDDEAVVAPLLSRWCRDDAARCTFLIMTRGALGACLRVDGCLPDIASVRAGEAGQASQYFNADEILLTLPDGGGSMPPSWRNARPDLVSTISSYIEGVHPDLILTFDPRHGTTCHPDHRAVAEIVLEAVRNLPFQPQIYLLESRVAFSTAPFAIQFYPATTAAQAFDANRVLSSTGAPAWDAILDDMQRHASQFDGPWLAAIRSVAPSDRAVFIAPAESVLQQNVIGCP